MSDPGAAFAVTLADARDAAVVGGKGASLGELTRAGVAVPRGFVVTVDAFASLMAVISSGEHTMIWRSDSQACTRSVPPFVPFQRFTSATLPS